ncbi:hypothetical protein [Maribacter cobaltidurans]|uniref:Uncharacterized protein n=1 Tax=Maribacter cobaltidurans TaxID=1178778 RepID=A0A223VAP0_9FLAO|nr:hypothetical protein [Maribacter cobaltidurans]ASV32038.1 hypothetical protein CJ263_18460 [Maribacter cobaltidurans]GGD86676.1 hypothetical protein GCM10011412_25670 [Maribacter cobaltidurans]
MLKKLLRILGIIVLVIVIAFGTIYALYNEPLPEGRSGPEADALAQKMLNSLNYDQYKNTRFIEWSFRDGSHLYKWDRNNKKVEVQWDDYRVNLDLIATESSIGYRNGERLNAKENEDVIEDAVSMFNNDSFWLVAPYKVFDPGTRREVVALEDGSEGLLVTFNSGGTTPGDSYLWILQPSGFPKSFKMWVKIIPIGGVEATWDDWLVTDSGAFLPKTHVMGPLEISMGDVRGYNR